MEVDPTSLKPIFIQIAEWIEEQIMNHSLHEGDQIPTTNQLALEYQINPATAGKGINLLVGEGILYKKRGIGMFVADGAYKKIHQKRNSHFEKETLPIVLSDAKQLGITKEELINMIVHMPEY